MTALAARCLHLSQQRLLGVVSEPLGVGVGGELVNGTGLDLVLNLLGGAATAVSQSLVLAVPACTLVSTLGLKS